MKTKILLIVAVCFAFTTQVFAQPANDTFAGAIPITPNPEGTGCSVGTQFYLPFSTDGTTDSGLQGGCRASGLDQFFTWTATTTGLAFFSQNPGNPGIVVYDAITEVEIACTNTFATEVIGGWDIGDDLVIQIYDFEGTALSDVAFCLEASTNAPVPTPVTWTSSSSGSSGSYRYGCVDMNGDFLDDMVAISQDNVNIRQQLPGGGFTTIDIPTTNANFLPTWSLSAADYNRDGWTDLAYGAGNGVTFMRSDGTGTGFVEVSGPEDVFSQRGNFVDIDKDGNLDMFMCHDVAPNVYYINDGSGGLTYYESDDPSAPYNLGDYPSGGDYGSIWIDYDNDRDLDLFIAKCGGEVARRTNVMFTNDGNENYTENAAAIGLADPMQTWSSAWGDFDGDGDMDVFVGASSGSHKLMENDNGVFGDVSLNSGVDLLSLTSTETVTYDFDNDGNLDLVSGGNILFGRGDMTFSVHTNVFPGAGAYGDLNNDGYIDAFNSGQIYLNNAETNNNWIKVNMVGTATNINGIGARVEIYTPSGVQMRDITAGDGFRYMSTMNAHFGIGTDTSVSKIVVYWPNSDCEEYLNPAINQAFTAVEGSGDSCDTLSNDDQNFETAMVISPIPTRSVLNIATQLPLDNAIFTVYDLTGKIVINGQMNSKTIDVSSLSTGNYILRIMSKEFTKTQKFIKQ
ncbi:MAG: VCBS repeat-containing protein [Psychroserpens sp.]|nr:VCBS repeat-containing protein [Psychroserpens sp.]